ncbi:hypothetical protein AKJ16_DCAP27161 [Drosera capensis]
MASMNYILSHLLVVLLIMFSTEVCARELASVNPKRK